MALILEALAAASDATIHLIVVGGTESEIRNFKAITTSPWVHFVGLQNDIRPFLWSSDAFVFPSAYEGFPLVCLQAAAAGLPLIATRINGIAEFIEDGVNGWIVERTTRSIQSAIQEAALSPRKTASMGRAARERAQKYRQELFQNRWLELLLQKASSLC